ncbi:hypothetical protein EP47_11145 [Legionella norrlandica]|uniref:OTU domain-containing protein n=1 Tax=Legionella norrlandica TaxID=1498499 RepID=A0A0A2SSY0_9GAMM|nr:hypothetical protein [Legionella norrlandica]KGP62549.1 hypothetical protein EP47_11145 [Legionella norrlandica]
MTKTIKATGDGICLFHAEKILDNPGIAHSIPSTPPNGPSHLPVDEEMVSHDSKEKEEGVKVKNSNISPMKSIVTEDQKKLEHLKQIVANATLSYTTYSEGIWFSFFHRHGKTGQIRANNFNEAFSKISDYNEAKETLVQYLNDGRNGNTYPHSFRTMLLFELQGNHEKKKDLQYLSKQFTSALNILASFLDAPLFANKYGK